MQTTRKQTPVGIIEEDIEFHGSNLHGNESTVEIVDEYVDSSNENFDRGIAVVASDCHGLYAVKFRDWNHADGRKIESVSHDGQRVINVIKAEKSASTTNVSDSDGDLSEQTSLPTAD